MIYPRFLAKALAFLGGYFWLPCSFCGEKFAGFEWGFHNGPLHDENVKATCSRRSCVEKGIIVRDQMRDEVFGPK